MSSEKTPDSLHHSAESPTFVSGCLQIKCGLVQSVRGKNADGRFYSDKFVLQGVQCCNVGDSSERCELCGPPLVLDR